MSANNAKYTDPPKMGDKTYSQWKSEIDLWRSLTSLPKNKQGIAVALSIDQPNARAIAIGINKEELILDTGVEKVIQELDKLFEKDKSYQMHDAFEEFESFRRKEENSMLSYIVEFEQLQKKCERLEITFPDQVLALKLLSRANLNSTERHMTL